MNNFYDRLKEERKRLGYTQPAIAKKVGIGKTTQSNYEAGVRTPNADYFVMLANEGFDVAYILSDHGVRAAAEDGAAYGGRRTAELVRLFDAASPSMQAAVIAMLKAK